MNRFNIMHDIDPNQLNAVINKERAMPGNVVNRNLGLAQRNELIALFMRTRPPRQ